MKTTTVCAFIFPGVTELPETFKDKHNDNKKLAKQILEKVAKQIKHGKTEFLIWLSEDMAEWVETLVLALKKQMPEVKLTCVLSCETNGEKLTININKTQRQILSRADSIAYLSQKKTLGRQGDGYHYLVDHADYIMAFYSGDPDGVVAHTLYYAQKQKKWISIFSPSGTPIAPLADSHEAGRQKAAFLSAASR